MSDTRIVRIEVRCPKCDGVMLVSDHDEHNVKVGAVHNHGEGFFDAERVVKNDCFLRCVHCGKAMYSDERMIGKGSVPRGKKLMMRMSCCGLWARFLGETANYSRLCLFCDSNERTRVYGDS